jgi:putative transposon-encoded protein
MKYQEWFMIRESILQRDNYTCTICHKLFDEDDLVIQHVIPRRLGGSDSPINLSTMCSKCHGVTELRNKMIVTNRRITEGAIIKEATKVGGSCHIIVPREWIGRKIRCEPI